MGFGLWMFGRWMGEEVVESVEFELIYGMWKPFRKEKGQRKRGHFDTRDCLRHILKDRAGAGNRENLCLRRKSFRFVSLTVTVIKLVIQHSKEPKDQNT